MAKVASDFKIVSDLVKHEYKPEYGYCRKVVTVNETAETVLSIGSVLGKVTADGKYKTSDPVAVDGSEAAAAVVVEAITVPAATDTEVEVLVRGPVGVLEDSAGGLVFDVAHDATQTATAEAELEALGFQVIRKFL